MQLQALREAKGNAKGLKGLVCLRGTETRGAAGVCDAAERGNEWRGKVAQGEL